MRKFGLAIIAAVAAGCGASTGYQVPGGPSGCEERCAGEGMVMDSFVFVGDYASGCVCRPASEPAPPHTTPAAPEAAPETAAPEAAPAAPEPEPEARRGARAGAVTAAWVVTEAQEREGEWTHQLMHPPPSAGF